MDTGDDNTCIGYEHPGDASDAAVDTHTVVDIGALEAVHLDSDIRLTVFGLAALDFAQWAQAY